ncbi:hypothetical protein LZC95_38475 [Pendulispora brunnea]|uniref:Cytochrome c domain-containing protein n=1 Tax=Pendulispora brunnea TaxID=2905690 RepID=A0ABZ2K5B9_9BACT
MLLAFDRLLLPSTVVRQSIYIFDGFNVALSPTVQYDPVTRVVTLGSPRQSEWLKPGQPYKIVFTIPSGNEDNNGLRAIDRATLDPASERVIGFFTDSAPTGTPGPPRVDFCTDVLPIFQQHCSAGQCHGEPGPTTPSSRFPDGQSHPAAGLVLETPGGVLSTAIGIGTRRVAIGSNTGPRTLPQSPGRMFGLDMPIVDPGSAANSWLLYKLLLAPPPPPGTPPSVRRKCDGSPGTPPQGGYQPPVSYAVLSDAERARLADFIPGNRMPYPPDPASGDRRENLTVGEVQRISTWIAQGAVTNECACEP